MTFKACLTSNQRRGCCIAPAFLYIHCCKVINSNAMFITKRKHKKDLITLAALNAVNHAIAIEKATTEADRRAREYKAQNKELKQEVERLKAEGVEMFDKGVEEKKKRLEITKELTARIDELKSYNQALELDAKRLNDISKVLTSLRNDIDEAYRKLHDSETQHRDEIKRANLYQRQRDAGLRLVKDLVQFVHDTPDDITKVEVLKRVMYMAEDTKRETDRLADDYATRTKQSEQNG